MPDADQAHYRLMLDRLTAFEEGQIPLDRLVDDLEGLLNVLAKVEPTWEEMFLGLWGELEDERAYALFKGIKVLDEETSEGLRATVAQLKELVQKRIEHRHDDLDLNKH